MMILDIIIFISTIFSIAMIISISIIISSIIIISSSSSTTTTIIITRSQFGSRLKHAPLPKACASGSCGQGATAIGCPEGWWSFLLAFVFGPISCAGAQNANLTMWGELLDRFRGSGSGRTWIQVTAHLFNTSSPRLRAALWDYVLEVGGCD